MVTLAEEILNEEEKIVAALEAVSKLEAELTTARERNQTLFAKVCHLKAVDLPVQSAICAKFYTQNIDMLQIELRNPNPAMDIMLNIPKAEVYKWIGIMSSYAKPVTKPHRKLLFTIENMKKLVKGLW